LEKRIQTVGPFADIQTMDDVKKLQREDPFRFQEYQVHIWEEQAQQAELAEARSRQSAEQKAAWAEFTRAESKALGDYVSESDIKTYSPKAGEYLLELRVSRTRNWPRCPTGKSFPRSIIGSNG
jgi:hypothetical protein